MTNASPFLSQFRRALVLCAHTDDEFGCAGTILRLVDSGVEVHYVALSACEESVPDGLPRDVLRTECRQATAALGIAPENVTIGDFQVRHFPRDRQAVLEQFVALRREIEPDLVLLPSTTDTHQDHAVVSQEGFRAFKSASLLGYELPQNLASFQNTAFVRHDEVVFQRKMTALRCYASQGFRPYSTEAFVRGLAVVRGVQSGGEMAEAFELIRLVLP